MDAIREVAAPDIVKKKSKKSKSTEAESLGSTTASSAVTDVVSSVDMDSNSNREKKEKDRSRKKKKEKDRSRKENKEKDISGLYMKDQENDHKREKKKKESQMGDEGRASKTDGEIHEGSEHMGSSEVKTMKKDKKSKHKNKEVKRKELDYAGENDNVGHDGSVENQIDNEVTENVEPVHDKKRKKKKGEEDLGAELLHDSHMHSVNHEENTSGSGSKKKEKSGRSKTGGDTDIGASASNDQDHAAAGADFTDNQIDNEGSEKVLSKDKKRKKKKKKEKDEGASSSASSVENSGVDGSNRNKEKSNGPNTKRNANAGSSKTNKRKRVAESSEKSASSKKSKKVHFSDQDEVFTLTGDSGKDEKELDGRENGNKNGDGLIRGKRFSKEEDEIVKKAVLDYIEAHQLGEEGLHMVMKCKAYPELKDCWKEIGESLPWRPYSAVYYRAHILFERGERRKWTEEELDLVKKYHEKHGANWKALAEELGKHRFHVKDAWRRIKLPNRKNGQWSQEEYQSLFDLVNTDLKMKAFEDKKSKHGMLRDNISWEAISEKLSTRSTPICCMKWYQQLTSPLVAEGKWADTDDYRLLIELVDLDAACEEDVDWDNLLEHRSGEVCRKRWNQMVLHIGEHGIKPFSEQVDILSQRYCPELLEPREIYANKPYVD